MRNLLLGDMFIFLENCLCFISIFQLISSTFLSACPSHIITWQLRNIRTLC